MRKLPALFALTAAAVLTLGACTNASETSGGTVGTLTDGPSLQATFDPSTIEADEDLRALLPQEIQDSGVLVVGTNPQYAPAEFLGDDGQTPIGYDIDVIKAVGAVLGVEVEIQAAEFPAIIPALGSKFDLGISSFTITTERMAEANMISYFNAGEAFAVQTDNPKKIDPNNICGLKVAVQTGTVEDEGADELSAQCVADGKEPVEVLRYVSQADATTNLVGGKADVMYADSPIVLYAIEQTGGKVEQLGETFDSAPQGIAIAKADVQLAEAVQKAVQKLMDDGTFGEILTLWGNDDGALETAELNPVQ